MAKKSWMVRAVSWLLLLVVAVWIVRLFDPWYFGLAAVALLGSVGGSLLLLRGRARVVGAVGSTLVVGAAVACLVVAGRHTVILENDSGRNVTVDHVMVDNHSGSGVLKPGQETGFWFIDLNGPDSVQVWWRTDGGKPTVSDLPWGDRTRKPRTVHIVFEAGGKVESRPG